MTDYDALIESVLVEVRLLPRGAWERIAVEEIIPRHVNESGSPEAFFEWARHHRLWSFAVAECVERVCAKPAELAVEVLRAIIEERLEE